MSKKSILTVCVSACLIFMITPILAALDIQKTVSSEKIETYDYLEITLSPAGLNVENPFTDVQVTGKFVGKDGKQIAVDGFCDAQDGSIYRLRFMPVKAGRYAYTIQFKYPDGKETFKGKFQAIKSERRGLLRVDPKRPNHFVWEGTGEHYFWNGTTTYYLMGWQDDDVIQEAIDRLHGYKINRLRVLVYGRNNDRPWGQPVKTTNDFHLYLNPWPAKQAAHIKQPQFDLSRFQVSHWQKYERLLRYAREKDIIVSVIFFIGGQVYPTPFEAYSEEEILFYRYGVARLAAFSNVTWDLGNEHNFHREVPKWCDWLGPKVKAWDPYNHILSAHNVIYRTPGAEWNDIQLIQRWDEGQNAYMLEQRGKQAETGRVIPNINEEYGYEDLWEKYPGQRAAETRRKLAWEISMAGCYQTTGETAERGTGFPPDQGGGWVNGRGDRSMTMLRGYEHMVDFFTAADWWNFDPRNELVEGGAMCLAKPGDHYILYLPKGDPATIQLKEGNYRAHWFNPRTGQWMETAPANGPVWTTPPPPAEGDWAMQLIHDKNLEDRIPPGVVSVRADGEGDEVYVVFSELVDRTSATNPRHYSINQGVEIQNIELGGEHGKTAILSVDRLVSGKDYTLTVNYIADLSKRVNAIHDPIKVPFQFINVMNPLVEYRFNEGQGKQTANTGTTSVHIENGVLMGEAIHWSKNTPTNNNPFALDFGVKPSSQAVDLGKQGLEALKGLQSFTLTGWINARSNQVGSGGNRILCSVNNGGDGIDLVYLKDGRLQVGINEWPDRSPAKSSAGQIPFDPDAGKSNWRFFAVTYDATANQDHVKYYFGSIGGEARLDTAVSYNRGKIGYNAGPLTVGHFNPATRTRAEDRMCRGLLDDIRLFGSKMDDSGAFGKEKIRNIQKGILPKHAF
ncbi:DUF5060 domain-containing protein [bacterium]|nr:DUF5060 domain-containing protein [bacterium]